MKVEERKERRRSLKRGRKEVEGEKEEGKKWKVGERDEFSG